MARSAILMTEAMDGQPDSLWVELMAILLQQPWSIADDPYWRALAASQTTSQNNYVRFAAFTLFARGGHRDEIKQAVADDPSWLVSLVPELDRFGSLMFLDESPSWFWERSPNEQIMLLSMVSAYDFPKLICVAPKEKSAGPHLNAVITQWFSLHELPQDGSPYHRFMDGWDEHNWNSAYRELWQVIPDFPLLVQRTLIDGLPIPFDVEKEVVPGLMPRLNKGMQERLLNRPTFKLVETRRTWFEDNDRFSAGVAFKGQGGKQVLAEYLEKWDTLDTSVRLKVASEIGQVDETALIEGLVGYEVAFNDPSLSIDIEDKWNVRAALMRTVDLLKHNDPDYYSRMLLKIRVLNLSTSLMEILDDFTEEGTYQGYFAPLFEVPDIRRTLLGKPGLYRLFINLEGSHIPLEVLAEYGSDATNWVDQDPFKDNEQQEDIERWRSTLRRYRAAIDDQETGHLSEVEKMAGFLKDDQKQLLYVVAGYLSQTKILSTIAAWGVIGLIIWEAYQYF